MVRLHSYVMICSHFFRRAFNLDLFFWLLSTLCSFLEGQINRSQLQLFLSWRFIRWAMNIGNLLESCIFLLGLRSGSILFLGNALSKKLSFNLASCQLLPVPLVSLLLQLRYLKIVQLDRVFVYQILESRNCTSWGDWRANLSHSWRGYVRFSGTCWFVIYFWARLIMSVGFGWGTN